MGCPLFWGRTKSIYFLSIIIKIQNKLEGWKGKILSLGAKLTLIKHVLVSMPLYLISLINPTKQTFYQLNKIMANFFGMTKMGNEKRTGLDGPYFASYKMKED